MDATVLDAIARVETSVIIPLITPRDGVESVVFTCLGTSEAVLDGMIAHVVINITGVVQDIFAHRNVAGDGTVLLLLGSSRGLRRYDVLVSCLSTLHDQCSACQWRPRTELRELRSLDYTNPDTHCDHAVRSSKESGTTPFLCWSSLLAK